MTTVANKYSTEHAVAFTNGEGMDANGRNFEHYWYFDAYEWEECHDHVQWAFPSDIPSDFNSNAPVVNMQEYISGLTNDGRVNLGELINHYLISIGLAPNYTSNNVRFHTIKAFERLHFLLTPNNHNYRRLTRLLNLLFYFDSEWGDKLLDKLVWLAAFANAVRPGCVSDETVLYWRIANAGKLKKHV